MRHPILDIQFLSIKSQIKKGRYFPCTRTIAVLIKIGGLVIQTEQVKIELYLGKEFLIDLMFSAKLLVLMRLFEDRFTEKELPSFLFDFSSIKIAIWYEQYEFLEKKIEKNVRQNKKNALCNLQLKMILFIFSIMYTVYV